MNEIPMNVIKACFISWYFIFVLLAANVSQYMNLKLITIQLADVNETHFYSAFFTKLTNPLLNDTK